MSEVDSAHHVIVDEDGRHTCQVCGATGDAPPVLPCLGTYVVLNGMRAESGTLGYEMTRQLLTAQAERDEAHAALDRVRALHRPLPFGIRHLCEADSDLMPCSTIRAIDGPQAKDPS